MLQISVLGVFPVSSTCLDASARGSSCSSPDMPPGSDNTKRRRARTGCLKCRIRRRKCSAQPRFWPRGNQLTCVFRR